MSWLLSPLWDDTAWTQLQVFLGPSLSSILFALQCLGPYALVLFAVCWLTLITVPLVLLCLLKPERQLETLGLARFVGVGGVFPASVRTLTAIPPTLPHLPISRRFRGKLVLGPLACVPGKDSRLIARCWRTIRRLTDVASRETQTSNGRIDTACALVPLAVLPVYVVDLSGRRLTLHVESAKIRTLTVRDLLLEHRIISPAIIDLCHVRLTTREVPMEHELGRYHGETIRVLARTFGGAKDENWRSKRWTEQAAKLAKDWSEQEYGDKIACERTDFDDVNQVPQRMVDLFQVVLDRPSHRTPALLNSVVHESGLAWAEAQSARYQAYIASRDPTTARGLRISGVQRTWQLFLGTAPSSKKESDGKTFWGVLAATRIWIDKRAKVDQNLVIASARHRFSFPASTSTSHHPSGSDLASLRGTAGTGSSRQTPSDKGKGKAVDPAERGGAAAVVAAEGGGEAESSDPEQDAGDEGAGDEGVEDVFEYDPEMDDVEGTVEQIYTAWMLRLSEATKKLGKRLADTKVWTMHPFPPRIPSCKPASTKEEILKILSTRLFDTSWHDGRRGFTINKRLLRTQVEKFVAQILSTKSLDQLRVIEALPEVHITPDVLKRAGLIHKQITFEQHIIYYKCLKGDAKTVSKIQASPRPRTAQAGTDFNNFLTRSVPSAHVSELGLPPGNPRTPYLFHVGRLSVGVKARRLWEARENRMYDPAKGARFWVEAVAHSGGPDKIEYWVLSTGDLLFGADWVEHMRWHELMFGCLLANPAMTNLAYPGIDTPPPPLTPGGPINAPTTSLGRSLAGRRLRGEVLKRVIMERHGYEVDIVTALSLLRIGYKHHLDISPDRYLRKRSSQTSPRTCIAFDTTAGFDLPVEVKKYNKVLVANALLKIFACRIDQDERRITLRPASLASSPSDVELTPIDLRTLLSFRSAPGYFEKMIGKTERSMVNFRVRLIPFPLADPTTTDRWTFEAIADSTLAVTGSAGGSTSDSDLLLEIPMPPEAAALLLGRDAAEIPDVTLLDAYKRFEPHLGQRGEAGKRVTGTSTFVGRVSRGTKAAEAKATAQSVNPPAQPAKAAQATHAAPPAVAGPPPVATGSAPLPTHLVDQLRGLRLAEDQAIKVSKVVIVADVKDLSDVEATLGDRITTKTDLDSALLNDRNALSRRLRAAVNIAEFTTQHKATFFIPVEATSGDMSASALTQNVDSGGSSSIAGPSNARPSSGAGEEESADVVMDEDLEQVAERRTESPPVRKRALKGRVGRVRDPDSESE